jgi:hypothetical protein
VRIKSDDSAASVDEKSSSLSGSVSKTHVTAPAQEASGANRAKSEAALAPGETVRIKSDDAAASVDEKSSSLSGAVSIMMMLFVLAIAAGLTVAFVVSAFGRIGGASKIVAAAAMSTEAELLDSSVRYISTQRQN